MNKSGLIEQLYSRYYEPLMIIACSYTHDRQTAEDLVQNAFLKAILSYKPSGSFLSWANRVIRNDFLNSILAEKYRADNEYRDDTFAIEADCVVELCQMFKDFHGLLFKVSSGYSFFLFQISFLEELSGCYRTTLEYSPSHRADSHERSGNLLGKLSCGFRTTDTKNRQRRSAEIGRSEGECH